MSTAWETTMDDFNTVLQAHGLNLSANEKNKLFDELDTDAIEEGVLYYTDMDDQTNSMLDDIENFLIEKELVPAANKKFFSEMCIYCGGNCPHDPEYSCDEFQAGGFHTESYED